MCGLPRSLIPSRVLAHWQTFPALLDLFEHDYLPKDVVICGYARSSMSDDDLRKKIRPYLKLAGDDAAVLDEFLERVSYRSGMMGCHQQKPLSGCGARLGTCRQAAHNGSASWRG